MLDLRLFKNTTFLGANVTMMLVALAMFGVFFYVSLFMQNILGYSPTKAGASFLPMTILIILIAPFAGRYSDKVGSRWLVGRRDGCSSPARSSIFSRLGRTATFWNLFPGLIIGGVGMALTMTPTTAAAMGSVAVDKAGVGSAVLNSMRQVGGSLGIAIMGAIVAASSTCRRPPRGRRRSSSPASSTRSRSRPSSPSPRRWSRSPPIRQYRHDPKRSKRRHELADDRARRGGRR